MTETNREAIQNLILLLNERSDVTLKEIGDELGKSPAWVWQQVHDAKERAATIEETDK